MFAKMCHYIYLVIIEDKAKNLHNLKFEVNNKLFQKIVQHNSTANKLQHI